MKKRVHYISALVILFLLTLACIAIFYTEIFSAKSQNQKESVPDISKDKNKTKQKATRIAACVNGEEITYQEVASASKQHLSSMRLRNNTSIENRQKIEKQVYNDTLEQMIFHLLVKQEARKHKGHPNLTEQNIRKHLSEHCYHYLQAEFDCFIAINPDSAECPECQFEALVYSLLTITDKNILDVTEKEEHNYFLKHKADFVIREKRKARGIAILFGEKRDIFEAQQIAQTILLKEKEGTSFDILAKKYCECGKVEGHSFYNGQLFSKNDVMYKLLAEALFKIKKGQISEPIILYPNTQFLHNPGIIWLVIVDEIVPESNEFTDEVKKKVHDILLEDKKTKAREDFIYNLASLNKSAIHVYREDGSEIKDWITNRIKRLLKIRELKEKHGMFYIFEEDETIYN